MADLYVFRAQFQPILLPGETAHIIKADGELDVECRAVGALPEYQKDFGSVTSGTWLLNQTDTNLEMNDLQLSHLRIRVQDDVQLYLKNPSSVEQWRTMRTKFYLPKFPTLEDPVSGILAEFLWAASEFFVWEDEDPSFDFYPLATSSKCRVLFSGWRYSVKKIPGKGKITLWVNAWPTG